MRTRIRDVRRAKGLTLSELAARITPPTTAQTIGRLETGVRKVTLDWLQKIADALGCGVNELMAEGGDAAVPILGTLASDGVLTPANGETLTLASPGPDALAVKIASPFADLQVGDTVVCQPQPLATLAEGGSRDGLVELSDGRWIYGRVAPGTSPGRYAVVAATEGGVAVMDTTITTFARRVMLIRHYR
jgi:transcriptional regulator with XRE-family HTH domain